MGVAVTNNIYSELYCLAAVLQKLFFYLFFITLTYLPFYEKASLPECSAHFNDFNETLQGFFYISQVFFRL